jgi:hypothetical protein
MRPFVRSRVLYACVLPAETYMRSTVIYEYLVGVCVRGVGHSKAYGTESGGYPRRMQTADYFFWRRSYRFRLSVRALRSNA